MVNTMNVSDGVDGDGAELETFFATPANATRSASLVLAEPSADERAAGAAPWATQHQSTTHHPPERRIFRRHRPHPRDNRRFISQTSGVRRTLAGLIFGIAFVCASIAISGWLLQRSAFDPDRTGDLADVVLQDNRIKTQITNTIADAAACATWARQGHRAPNRRRTSPAPRRALSSSARSCTMRTPG